MVHVFHEQYFFSCTGYTSVERGEKNREKHVKVANFWTDSETWNSLIINQKFLPNNYGFQ